MKCRVNRAERGLSRPPRAGLTVAAGIAIMSLSHAATCPGAVLVQELGPYETTVTIDADRSDWTGIPSYPSDGNESAQQDWLWITVAHDTDNLYLRYFFNSNQSGYDNGGGDGDGPLVGDFNLALDMDLDRGTGWIGGGSEYGIGADYLLAGTSLFDFDDGYLQTDWSGWQYAATASSSDNNVWDYELAVPWTSLGGPQTFRFFAWANNGANPVDYYPDGAPNEGSGQGQYFQYNDTDENLPEPGVCALIALGALTLGVCRRRR